MWCTGKAPCECPAKFKGHTRTFAQQSSHVVPCVKLLLKHSSEYYLTNFSNVKPPCRHVSLPALLGCGSWNQIYLLVTHNIKRTMFQAFFSYSGWDITCGNLWAWPFPKFIWQWSQMLTGLLQMTDLPPSTDSTKVVPANLFGQSAQLQRKSRSPSKHAKCVDWLHLCSIALLLNTFSTSFPCLILFVSEFRYRN